MLLLFLWYFSDMQTCLFYILIAFFQKNKITKNTIYYNSPDTIIANKQQSQPSPNLPRSFRFVHYPPLFLLSLTFIPSFSSVLTLIGFCDARGRVVNRWVHIRLLSPENHMNFSDTSWRLQSSSETYLIYWYFSFLNQLSFLSTVLCILYDKLLLLFNFYLIISYLIQFSTLILSHFTSFIRTNSSLKVDLSSVQLLSPIIPHQQSRVQFVIRLYIYWLFINHPSGYPISDQLL